MLQMCPSEGKMLICLVLILLVLRIVQVDTVALLQEDEEEELVSRFVQDLLVHEELSGCSLVMSDVDMHKVQTMNRLLLRQSQLYSTSVSISTGHNAFRPKPWSEYIGLTGPEQMYSFTTMPPDMMSQVHLGHKCVLQVLVSDSPSTLPEQLVQVAGTVRVRNLDDFFFFHFRNMSREIKNDVMDHPAKGIRFKLISSKDENGLLLETVCFFCHDGNVSFQTLGIYPSQGVPQDVYRNKESIRRNQPIVIRFVHFETLDTTVSRKNQRILGKQYLSTTERMFVELENYLNAKMKVIVYADYGEEAMDSMRPNGSWTGSAAYILDGKADGGGIYILSDLHIRQVTYPTLPASLNLKFVTAVPQVVIPLDVLFLPFTPSMWMTLSVTWIVSGVVLWGVIRASGGSTSFGSSISSVLKMMIYQPNNLPPFEASRIFEASLWIASIIISCAYVTKVLAFLSAVSKTEMPKTLDELQQKGFESLIPLQTWILLKHATPRSSVDLELFNRSSFFPNIESCMDEVVGNSNKACVSYNYFIRRSLYSYMDPMGRNTLQVAPEESYIIYAILSFSKSFILGPNFSRFWMRVLEGGMVDQWSREESFVNYWLKRRRLRHEGGALIYEAADVGVKSENLNVLFAFWVIGMWAACVVFLVELAYRVCCKRKNNKIVATN